MLNNNDPVVIELQRLRADVEALKKRELPNQALDTASSPTFAALSLSGVLRTGGLTLPFFNMRRLSIANTATVQLLTTGGAGSNTEGIVLLVDETDDWVAIFSVLGPLGTTQEIADPNGKYSATAGTPTSLNIYWSGANGRIEAGNQLGHDIILTVFEFVGG